MTGNQPTERTVSIEEYLDKESHSLVRHEYVNGQLFGMVGSSAAHNLIALNLYVLLRGHTKGTGCAVFVSDMKVKIDAANSFYYPDVLVTCDRPEPTAKFVSAPLMIIEVWSPELNSPPAQDAANPDGSADSKKRHMLDARQKLSAYGQIDSLKEYVIVHQDKKMAEVYTRSSTGWQMQSIDSGQDLVLECLPSGPFRARLDMLYDEVGVE